MFIFGSLGFPLQLFDSQSFLAMAEIPEINDTEIWIMRTTLRERYGQEIPIRLADSEIRLNPSDRELTTCPICYWQVQNCNFVIFKIGERKYRCQFFFRLYQQYGTNIPEYDDLAECVVALLQTQADYEAKERGDLPVRR